MPEGERRVQIILDLLAENPSITPDELDEEIDRTAKERQSQGKDLPEPSASFKKKSEAKILNALEKEKDLDDS